MTPDLLVHCSYRSDLRTNFQARLCCAGALQDKTHTHTVNGLKKGLGLKKDSSQWHCSTCPLLLFWSPAASCATNIFPLLKPTWVTATLSVNGVAQMYVYSYGCSWVCFLFIHSGCILHLLLFPYLYRWKNIFWHIGALVCTQLIHYLCHCLCQARYTHTMCGRVTVGVILSLCASCDWHLSPIKYVQWDCCSFFCLMVWAVKDKRDTLSKRIQIFFFYCIWLCVGVQKHAKNSFFIYILVHIYIVTTAFHRDVPCVCFHMSDLCRRVSTFREMHRTTLDWHPETQRQQAPSRTSGQSHEKHSSKSSHPWLVLCTASLSSSSSSSTGCNNELKSSEISPVAHLLCCNWDPFIFCLCFTAVTKLKARENIKCATSVSAEPSSDMWYWSFRFVRTAKCTDFLQGWPESHFNGVIHVTMRSWP